VNVPASAGPAATGTVLIKRVPGSILLTRTISNGTVTARLPNLTRGTWTIYSQYSGNDHYFGAYSNSVVLRIT
jgi:hypothetical protein